MPRGCCAAGSLQLFWPKSTFLAVRTRCACALACEGQLGAAWPPASVTIRPRGDLVMVGGHPEVPAGGWWQRLLGSGGRGGGRGGRGGGRGGRGGGGVWLSLTFCGD